MSSPYRLYVTPSAEGSVFSQVLCSRAAPPDAQSPLLTEGEEAIPEPRARPAACLPIMSHQALAQSQLAEYIHHDFHGRLVCHCEGTEVQDAPQFQHGGGAWRQWGRVVSEINN